MARARVPNRPKKRRVQVPPSLMFTRQSELDGYIYLEWKRAKSNLAEKERHMGTVIVGSPVLLVRRIYHGTGL